MKRTSTSLSTGVIQMYVSCLLVLAACTLSYAQSTEPAKEQVESLYQQAIEYHNAGEYDKAIGYYTKVIELDAAYVNAYWYRGLIYAYQEKYDLAIADLRKVNVLAPDFADAYGSLGWYLILQGNFEEA